VTTDQLLVALSVEVALAAIGVGLLARGRWRLSWFFSAYVAAILVGNVLVTWWPQAFFVPGFWMAKQIVYDVLKLGLALELAWRTFRVFPGAGAAARRVVLVILLLTTIVTIAASGGGFSYLTMAGDIHPRVVNGTIWLLAVTLGLAQWYRVPIHPFHRAVLASLGAYLAVFGALLRVWGIYGWAAQAYFNALDPLAYLLLTLYWAHLAWRPESALARAHVETLRKVELRAASCG
jgi:hypothetical protein